MGRLALYIARPRHAGQGINPTYSCRKAIFLNFLLLATGPDCRGNCGLLIGHWPDCRGNCGLLIGHWPDCRGNCGLLISHWPDCRGKLRPSYRSLAGLSWQIAVFSLATGRAAVANCGAAPAHSGP